MSNFRIIKSDIEFCKENSQKLRMEKRNKLNMIHYINDIITCSRINNFVCPDICKCIIKNYYDNLVIDKYSKTRLLHFTLVHNIYEEDEEFNKLIHDKNCLENIKPLLSDDDKINVLYTFRNLISQWLYHFINLDNYNIEDMKKYCSYLFKEYEFDEDKTILGFDILNKFLSYIPTLYCDNDEDYKVLKTIDEHIKDYIKNKTLSNVIDANTGIYLLYIFRSNEKIFEYIKNNLKYLDDIIDKTYYKQYKLIEELFEN